MNGMYRRPGLLVQLVRNGLPPLTVLVTILSAFAVTMLVDALRPALVRWGLWFHPAQPLLVGVPVGLGLGALAIAIDPWLEAAIHSGLQDLRSGDLHVFRVGPRAAAIARVLDIVYFEPHGILIVTGVSRSLYPEHQAARAVAVHRDVPIEIIVDVDPVAFASEMGERVARRPLECDLRQLTDCYVWAGRDRETLCPISCWVAAILALADEADAACDGASGHPPGECS